MSGIVVFMDWQNIYKRARSAFYTADDPDFVHGQVWPHKVAHILADRHNQMSGSQLSISDIRIYRGAPRNEFDPTGYNAFQRQTTSWKSHNGRVSVHKRDINYPTEINDRGERVRSDLPPKEKGVDVSLAVDLTTMGVEREYEHAIVFTSDNDLIPAVEYVHRRAEICPGSPTISVAAWDGGSRIRPKGRRVFCHWLYESDFLSTEDLRDYTLPTTTSGPPRPGPR